MGRAAALAAALLSSACVVPPPAGPSVGALPPKGKDAAQFQQDDFTCRQYASQMLNGAQAAQYSWAAQQQQYDQDYTQCMTAHGNIAPVATAGVPAYAYPYYPYPYYPYAYADPYYPYGYPWYWGAPVGFGTSFVFVGHGHRHGGHFHGGHGSGPRH
jgi:hypothetical protein